MCQQSSRVRPELSVLFHWSNGVAWKFDASADSRAVGGGEEDVVRGGWGCCN